jgi:hypothetical protein
MRGHAELLQPIAVQTHAFLVKGNLMGQSIGSTGNSKKRPGAGSQKKHQPELQQGQKMSDQGGRKSSGKPEGGADHGPRSVR